ncbi:hypothetical protein NDU88_003739 [Pleurodeles waltl]|uniref:Uncharacterized protein n=1 Tax=Pleurodeles waltl TaxID=8319 RepID=A0AAV7NHH7_PLEWA|nr:hypothetical protein NDU88_003739 [Pleurodeles waltl]
MIKIKFRCNWFSPPSHVKLPSCSEIESPTEQQDGRRSTFVVARTYRCLLQRPLLSPVLTRRQALQGMTLAGRLCSHVQPLLQKTQRQGRAGLSVLGLERCGATPCGGQWLD